MFTTSPLLAESGLAINYVAVVDARGGVVATATLRVLLRLSGTGCVQHLTAQGRRIIH